MRDGDDSRSLIIAITFTKADIVAVAMLRTILRNRMNWCGVRLPLETQILYENHSSTESIHIGYDSAANTAKNQKKC